MEPIYLFDLAASQARWLAVRQATVAENVANANTPGYMAKDVAPFTEIYQQTQLQLVSTNPAHMGNDPLDLSSMAGKDEQPWEVTPSGNSVSMEREMLKANEVSRSYAMNTAIVKAFNQMMSLGLKGAT
jgi:flagellar basal-body rod protein FlgB